MAIFFSKWKHTNLKKRIVVARRFGARLTRGNGQVQCGDSLHPHEGRAAGGEQGLRHLARAWWDFGAIEGGHFYEFGVQQRKGTSSRDVRIRVPCFSVQD